MVSGIGNHFQVRCKASMMYYGKAARVHWVGSISDYDIDYSYDVVHGALVCWQLTELLAYCKDCDTYPVLFELNGDETSMVHHLDKHDNWKRSEIRRLLTIAKAHIYPHNQGDSCRKR